MIVVDTSVWVNRLRLIETEAVGRLRLFLLTDVILVGDLVLLESLNGARDGAHAVRLAREMRRYAIEPMCDEAVAVQTASNYRQLRARGITVRKTVDLIIGTFCIERGHPFLHDDRDFEPMAAHLGLRVA